MASIRGSMQVRVFSLPANTISKAPAMGGKQVVAAAPALPSGPSGPSGPAVRMMAVGGLPGLIGTQPFGAGQASG